MCNGILLPRLKDIFFSLQSRLFLMVKVMIKMSKMMAAKYAFSNLIMIVYDSFFKLNSRLHQVQMTLILIFSMTVFEIKMNIHVETLTTSIVAFWKVSLRSLLAFRNIKVVPYVAVSTQALLIATLIRNRVTTA